MTFILRALLVLSIGFAMSGASARADDILDGRSFKGMIGPAENPDLQDSLFFEAGHFWSDICSRCGFLPGRYKAERTDRGISFSGTLASESRGVFIYKGFVSEGGEIQVDIEWEKSRWYWTSRRMIAFKGERTHASSPVTLEAIRAQIAVSDPDGSPACARF